MAILAWLLVACLSITWARPGERVLALFSRNDDASKFGALLGDLQAEGYLVDVHHAASAQLKLRKYSEYLYEHVILIAPSTNGKWIADIICII